MTTIRLAACFAVALPLSAQAGGGHCPPDKLTPPPCTAEGGCLPNRSDYGYYEGRWRRWPGDYDEATPTPADDLNESAMPTVEPIPKELEDRQAPPPSETEPEDDEESGADSEMELPPLPGLPGLPGMPNSGAAPSDTPTPPSGGSNPPPGLPFGPPAGFGPTPAPSGGAAPAGGGTRLPGRSSQNWSDDRPPALPHFGRTPGYGPGYGGAGGVTPVAYLSESR